MHHFQLKPVRSLDSLRPAWSGQLRHGPPPSIVIANPYEVPSARPVLTTSLTSSSSSSSSFHHPASDKSVDRSRTLISNSLAAKSNSRAAREADKSSSLLPSVSHASCNRSAEPNRFLHELHARNDAMKSYRGNVQSQEKCSPNDRAFNFKDIFASTDSIANEWDAAELHVDRSYKTSNFLHEANEDDPFDTSKVFTPTYLQTAPLYKSTVPSMPVQFHPLPHPYTNTTPCSAHAKVNIISLINLFYVYETFSDQKVYTCVWVP